MNLLKKPKQNKNEGFFLKLFNRILKLKSLKMFEVAIGFIKGFSVKVEFFENKENKNVTKS